MAAGFGWDLRNGDHDKHVHKFEISAGGMTIGETLGGSRRDEVARWRDRLDDLGEPHGGIVTGHRGGSVLVGLHDPDGLEIRLYAD